MDAKETKAKPEIGMSEKRTANGGGGEVVLLISNEQTPKYATKGPDSKDSPQRASTESATGNPKSVPVSCPSPEILGFSPSANKPPRTPNAALTHRRSLRRSLYSRPKSRFGEQPQPVDDTILEETISPTMGLNSPYRTSFDKASPNNKSTSTMKTMPITPKTPLMRSPGGPGDDFEEIFKKVELSKERQKRTGAKVFVEWVTFLCIIGCLVASLTVNKLEKYVLWGLELWKWCVLVMVIFCGLYVTNWVMFIIVFLIEKNFLLQKKVLYFVQGLKKSIQVFVWFGLILLTWVLLFRSGVKRSETANRILDYISWTLVSLLIGSFLWVLKDLLIKILASKFHVKTFFDRIQESVFHQYVLQTLSGPPLVEEARRVGRSPSAGQFSFISVKKGKEAKERKVIDMGKVHELRRGKVTAWNMKILVDAVMNSGLSTISNTLEECVYDTRGEHNDKEITNEMEAKAAAYCIFKNVAHPGTEYIDEDDLLRFMIKEEVDLVFSLFEGAERGRIDKKSLANWVVKVYNERKALAHALSDTKTAVKQLNKIVTGIIVVASIIIWLLLMEIATTKVMLLLSSQLVAAAFLFGNTCKTIFEAIIFVFVMHPFDVGDRCCVDGVPLLVEEMNILNTVFLKLDNEKVYYPNSFLATKPISNYFRSPDMGDTIQFSIDFQTPISKMGLLKERIKKCLEENPQHWHPNHTLVVKEIENMNKIKMALYCNHTMNFQDWAEKNRRRTDLVIEMKKIFEELGVKYDLLPQEVLLSHTSPKPTR